MQFVFELAAPATELISNVRCVGFSGDRVLIIDTREFGISAFPGGMLEPGEVWTDALERELLEETGTRPLGYEVVGRLHFWSGADKAHRPHLPYPEFEQVVGWADVEVVGAPTNPRGGEHVLSVAFIPLERAIGLVREQDPWHAELLRLVADVRGRSARRVR